jgi:3-hydroxybutyrate dehydrogenase
MTIASTVSSAYIVLITGASRGIGKALAQSLYKAGHKIVATARRVDDLSFLPDDDRLLKLSLDVCDQASIDQVRDTIYQQWEKIDVLINNAGVAGSAPLHRTSDELWNQMLDINLTGSFKVTRAFLPALRKQSYGRIIFISSIAGLSGCLYTSAYCASKHAVIGMMRALALELARTSVTCNAICPGFVETDMAYNAINQIEQNTERTNDQARSALEEMSPQNRLIQPEEIVAMIQFLMIPASQGVHGQALSIDGGQTMH